MPEKRTGQDKRIPLRLAVRFGVDDIGNIGFTADISPGGIFLKSAVVFPVGTTLKVEITSDENDVIRLVGDVHWSKQVAPNLVWSVNDAGMGVRIRTFVCGQKHFYRLLASGDRC